MIEPESCDGRRRVDRVGGMNFHVSLYMQAATLIATRGGESMSRDTHEKNKAIRSWVRVAYRIEGSAISWNSSSSPPFAKIALTVATLMPKTR
jgi:hypothetical protein